MPDTREEYPDWLRLATVLLFMSLSCRLYFQQVFIDLLFLGEGAALISKVGLKSGPVLKKVAIS